MVKLITIKKDGKITLPKDVRKEMGLTGEEQYVLVYGDRELFLKKVETSKDQKAKRLKDLMDEFHKAFKKNKITKKDIETAIRDVRNGK